MGKKAQYLKKKTKKNQKREGRPHLQHPGRHRLGPHGPRHRICLPATQTTSTGSRRRELDVRLGGLSSITPQESEQGRRSGTPGRCSSWWWGAGIPVPEHECGGGERISCWAAPELGAASRSWRSRRAWPTARAVEFCRRRVRGGPEQG
jgi:hypothetical protein